MINKMKRVNLFFIAAFVAASSMLIVSCGDDPVDDPEVTVKVKYSDGQYDDNLGTNAEVVKDKGIDVTFSINFKQGTNKMSEIHITSTIQDIGTFAVWDTTKMQGGILNLKGGKVFDKTIKTTVGAVTEKFEFTMIDTKDNPYSFILTVVPSHIKNPPTTPVLPGSYSSSTVKLYGQSSNAGGSSYSLKLGRDVKLDEARSQPQTIDFMYYYGTTNKATISSPKDGQITDIFSSVSGWTKRNDTKFAQVTLPTGTSVPSNEQHDTWWSSIPAEADILLTKAADLKVNDVYAFKVEGDSKIRVFVVTATGTATASGNITLRIIEKN